MAALGFCVVGGVVLGACSGDDAPSSTPGDGGPSSEDRLPPAKPNAPATSTGEEHNYAIHRLYLGGVERTPTGDKRNDAAWRTMGYDLDGRRSDPTSTDLCTLAPGAQPANQADGEGGIDNSFGENVVPLLRTFNDGLETELNTSIDQGGFTVMFDVVGLDDAALLNQTATGLRGLLFTGTRFDPVARPTWTVADDWPVNPDLLDPPSDPKSSKVRFPDAYVVGGTFVNGSGIDVPLSLSVSGVPFLMTVHSAVVTFQHGARGKATNGVIAGVVDTEEFLRGLHQVLGNISSAACGFYDLLATQIRQTADILLEGGKIANRAGVPCNAISVGLAFEADEIGPPQKVGEASHGGDTCSSADGGTDAASDALADGD